MSAFRGFVVKEFYHILRDRRTLLILFGMPVIQLVLFGFAIRNEVNDVRVVIVDPAGDHVTQALTSRLLASPYFEGVEYRTHAEGLERVFQQGQAKEVILFEPRFAHRLAHDGVARVQVLTDATDPNTANTILAYTTALLQAAGQSLAAAPPPGLRIVPEVRMRYNPTLKSVYLFVPGLVALILMLVCALMTSITITREKETGTMEVLLVSPLRPGQIIVGKVLPYLFLSLAIVSVILVLARTVFGVPLRGSAVLLVLECLLFIACALSLGILISTRTRTQQTAMMISLAGLLLPTVILSGFIFPLDSMPPLLQGVSHLVPAKWFLLIVRGIMIKGVGMAELWQETLILAGMTAFFLVASVRNFSVRLD
ncbi:ABC transporter permease [Rhodocaloribacter litoris]|uniref:ABC transporter permease n=1 Tax=Rhodocaloribacter litoris TaxID=2558931 RepID=UPI0014227B0B|nr:ABC transporter permease [Rhodocaloribacter litoris]QXD16328.1 ABC transporter permease [Rhodocaloribacter litoris]